MNDKNLKKKAEPFINIAVLTSKNSWFYPISEQLVNILKSKNYNSKLFFDHKKISSKYKIVFILSYSKIIDKDSLSKHQHNLVVHASNLPKGRGMSPLSWQVLKGKNKIPLVLFEATEKLDAGYIYIKDSIKLLKSDLNETIRKKQAQKTITFCLKFLDEYTKLKPVPQIGKPTFYKTRTPQDSKLDINKTIKEQFNLLRIVNNEEFPAFFYYQGHKYVLKIYKAKE